MPKDDEKSGQVRSVTRALTILRLLSEKPEGMTLTETAEAARLPASTAHRLLTTLEGERFVRFDPSHGLWQVGVSAFTVGAAFQRARDVIQSARPYLRRLVEQTGETANIYLESEGEVICMDQVESRHSMRAITRVGGRAKMHWSAAGKAILANLSPEARARIVEAHGLPRATARTITEPAALEATLARIRDEGVAVDDEEHAIGLRCVAAAILDEHGEPAAAISVSGPTTRITDDKLARLAIHVRNAAAEAGRDYGGAQARPAARA